VSAFPASAAVSGPPHAVSRAWATYCYLALGALAIASYFVLSIGEQAVLYVAIGLSGAVAIVLGARRHLTSGRVPWYLFAAGLAASTAGDALFNLYDVVLERSPFPSVADVAYLGAYPLYVAGLVLLVRRLGAGAERGAFLDAAIITVGFALAQWVFLMAPLARDESLSMVERSILLAYPAMDVLLLAALARFFITPASREPAFGLLVGSVLALVAADEIFGAASASYDLGSSTDALWLASYVLWGAAALHPSMASLARSGAPGQPPRLTWSRVALLTAALLTASTVLLFNHGRVHPVVIAVFGSVLALLVLARIVDLVRGIERLTAAERLAREEADAARAQLAAQNERLRELDALKDEFVSLVSHELRTPLTSIVGYVELLLDEEAGLDEGQRRFLRVVERNSARLLTLVNDLLLVARIEQGLELEREAVDVAELARESLETARPRAEEGGVELVLDAPPVPPVSADRGRLAQVLDNLVANAVKFTPGGRAGIVLGRNGDDVSIEVFDTGIGIPEQEQRRLFGRFYRASTAVDRQIGGTGLGLYVTKAIVEAHGGTISFTSSEGEGTTFRVELPAAA
jgi:signal transduction histidine kinase